MELRPSAKAVAQLDAVCDQYEQALRSGQIPLDGNLSNLDPWLSRVAPNLQSWLRDELLALRAEFELIGELQDATCGHLMDSEAWRAVNNCETFRALSREAKLSLAASLKVRTFSQGEFLLRSGQRDGGLLLITEGRIQVLGDNGHEQFEIDTDGAGAMVGEMSTLTGYPCAADVLAASPVRALVLPFAAVGGLLSEYPELEIALSQLVSDRLGQRRNDALCGKSLEGYRLQACIGTGAMGVVYKAVRETDGMSYAVKMLRHRFIYSSHVISRFDQEADLVGRLQHPNIVGLRGHFVAFRTRFIVLELFDGADLRHVLREGPVSESQARAILGQIAAGLQYAHGQGILHLDLKPANILVDQQGNVAISDFGLSRLIEFDGCDQECVGTPCYMPPEQFMMADLGPHCDWYSLSCIAHELVTGKRLFRSQESPQFLDDKFRAPSDSWPQMPASDEFCKHFRGGLHPFPQHRQLDLNQIATWARRVPELASEMNDRNHDG